MNKQLTNHVLEVYKIHKTLTPSPISTQNFIQDVTTLVDEVETNKKVMHVIRDIATVSICRGEIITELHIEEDPVEDKIKIYWKEYKYD